MENPMDKYSNKQMVINQYHARKTSCYKNYILAGGSGLEHDYVIFCEINQIKAEKLEAVLNAL